MVTPISGLLQDFSAKLDLAIKLRHEIENTSCHSPRILEAMLLGKIGRECGNKAVAAAISVD